MPAGRPRIEIDWEQFDKLCMIQCTLPEIACFFNCSPDTIERRVKDTHDTNFAAYFELKRGTGKISLRRKQFETAMSGNVAMLIWLGKNWLGQKDRREISDDRRENYSSPESMKDDKDTETQEAD